MLEDTFFDIEECIERANYYIKRTNTVFKKAEEQRDLLVQISKEINREEEKNFYVEAKLWDKLNGMNEKLYDVAEYKNSAIESANKAIELVKSEKKTNDINMLFNAGIKLGEAKTAYENAQYVMFDMEEDIGNIRGAQLDFIANLNDHGTDTQDTVGNIVTALNEPPLITNEEDVDVKKEASEAIKDVLVALSDIVALRYTK